MAYDVVQCHEGWKSLYQPIIDEVINFDICQTDPSKKIGIKSIEMEDGAMVISLINTHNASDDLLDKLDQAELASERMCEFCGDTQNVGTTLNYTYQTCCKECWEKHILPKKPKSTWKNYKTTKLYSAKTL